MLLRPDDDVLETAIYSPDGRQLVIASRHTNVHIWDVATGVKLRELSGHNRGVRSAAFGSSGKRVVTASFDNTARIWDAETGTELLIFRGHHDMVHSAVFNPRWRARSYLIL